MVQSIAFEVKLEAKDSTRPLYVAPHTYRMWCPFHLQPFGVTSINPFGARSIVAYGIATNLLRDELVKEPEFGAAIGALMRKEGISSDVKPSNQLIEQVLDEKSACCLVPAMTVKRIYHDTRFGKFRQCVGCRKMARGAPFECREFKAEHVCFHCITHNLEHE